MAKKRNLSLVRLTTVLIFGLVAPSVSLGTPQHPRKVVAGQKTESIAVSAPQKAQVPPREGVVSQRDETKPRTHRFFDRNNLIGFSAMFAGTALDHHSTCRFLRVGFHENTLPTQNCRIVGAVLYGASTGTIGLSYWLHRKGHHKIERWLPRIRAVSTGVVATWNYSIP